MRKIILLISFSIGIQWGMTQPPSLEETQKDTVFNNFLVKIGNSLWKREFDVTIANLKSAQKYADSHPDLSLGEKLAIPYSQSKLYAAQGKYRPAIEGYLKVVRQIEEHQLEYKTSFYSDEAWTRLGIIYRTIGKPDSAIFCYEKAMGMIALLSEKEQTVVLPNIETNIGNVYLENGKLNEALNHYINALEWRKKQEEIDSANLANTIGNIGLVYLRKGDREKSRFYNEEALKIKEKVLPANSYRLVNSYLNLAFSYFTLGQYEKANRYFEKVHLLTEDIINTPEKDTYRTLRINQAFYYQKIKEYAKAEKLLNEALAFSKQVWGQNDLRTAYCYDQLGNHFLLTNNYRAADSCLQHAFRIFNQSTHDSYLNYGHLIKRQAYSFYKQEKYQKALHFYQKADSIYKIATGPFSYNRGDVHESLGRIFAKMGECDKANSNYVEALNIFYKSQLKGINQLSELYNLDPIATLQAIILYVENLQLCYSSSRDSLAKAQIVLEQYHLMLNKFRNEIQEERDVVSLSEKSSYVDHLILENLFLSYPQGLIPDEQLANAFQRIDQNTHISLQRAGNIQSGQLFSALPSQVLESERSVKIELAYLEKSLETEKNKKDPDSLRITHLRNQLFTFQNRSDSLQKVIKDNYPNYYQLKYDPSVVPLNDLQKSIPSNTTLLRYILGESQNYAFIIDQKSIQLITLPIFELALIDTLREAMLQP
ncbi:MAG: tetratricopeptide repeat protein, partial [Bacteroidetes bacterium]|nr:tetratricopeptide repeat protein [Bacteroidota bacterium]